MRALLLVAEGLLAEGGGFLCECAARDHGGSEPSVRLGRRLTLLSFTLRSLAACLERRRGRADARAVERCLVHVRHDLALVGRLLPALTTAEMPLRLVAQRGATPPRSLAAACRRVHAEMRTVAALARSADQGAFALWAQRRAQYYLRRGEPDADGSITRTRSRGTSSRTRSASAVSAAMRG